MGSGGYLSSVGASLKTPFGNQMTWSQLAAVVVFVLIVTLAWRQVTLFILAPAKDVLEDAVS